MIIKLFQPTTRNWLLIAEKLNDPNTWDRFVPTHGPDSERSRFDKSVMAIATNGAKLKSCKELLKHGTRVFEYDWNTDEDLILGHAMAVADSLGLELLMDAPTPSGSADRVYAA
jgi:hypothetical protein